MSQKCRFAFDLDTEEPTTVNESDYQNFNIWKCPHDADGDSRFCLFHKSVDKKEDRDVRNAFLDTVSRTSESGNRTEFIGAKFGSLDLSQARIESDDNQPVDLRYSTIKNAFSCSNAYVRQPVRADGLQVTGETDLEDAVFENKVTFTDAMFNDRVNCSGTTFGGIHTDFQSAEFDKRVDFYAAAIEGVADFRGVLFSDEVDFEAVTFSHEARLANIKCCGAISFAGTTFRGLSRFDNSVFKHEAQFSSVSFELDVYFPHVEFQADAVFNGMSVTGSADFSEVVFGSEGGFSGVEFGGSVTFESLTAQSKLDYTHVEFHGAYADFTDAKLNGTCNFMDAIFYGVGVFAQATFDTTAYFKNVNFMSDSEFPEATFNGVANFRLAHFQNEADFTSAQFTGEDANFMSAILEQTLYFRDVTVRGELYFDSATFRGDIRGENISIHEKFHCQGIEFSGVIAEFTGGDFHGEVDYYGSEFNCILEVSDSHFTDDMLARQISVTDDTRFNEVVVEGACSFEQASFQRKVDFEDSRFNQATNFSGSEFTGTKAVFERCHFTGPTSFSNSNFAGDALFQDVTAEALFSFGRITVGGDANFQRLHVGGEFRCERTIFRGFLSLHDADIKDSLTCTDIHVSDRLIGDSLFVAEVAKFTNANFEGSGSFENSEFNGDTTFNNIEAEGTVTFRDTVFDTAPSFQQFHGTLEIVGDCQVQTSPKIVNIQSALIQRGIFEQPREGQLIFDFTNSTIGDVLFDNSDTGFLKKVQFSNTTFEGFDFSEYRQTFAEYDWQIHLTATDNVDIVVDQGFRSRVQTVWSVLKTGEAGDQRKIYATLESTYQKAKNGATDIEDQKTASEFFRKEMIFRRRSNWWLACSSAEHLRTRLRAGVHWLTNFALGLTAGHGERPSRVILSSLFVIATFSGVFWLLRPNNFPYGTALGYPILSLESFVTLILMHPTESFTDPFLRFAAEIEGFAGAFLIALFVTTLTRSIHR